MYLLFDIGGTKTRLAVSRDLKSFDEPVVFETPQKFEEGVEKISQAAGELTKGKSLSGAAGGVPVVLSPDKTELVSEGNLKEWKGKPLHQELQQALGTTLSLENDADLVGLGEAHHGAGKGEDDIVYITVSTGVGGGKITNGRIDECAKGFEPGRQVIDADRTLCPDCRSEKLEDMVSGTAMRHRFGNPAEELLQNDACWKELAKWLAVGVHNTIAHWSPKLVILGGSMIVGDPRIPLDVVSSEIVAILRSISSSFVPPPIKKAELGDVGGLYGAMTLLKQEQERGKEHKPSQP